MKVLVLGPWDAPIVMRLVEGLRARGVEVALASHGAKGVAGVHDLGPLNSFSEYFRIKKLRTLLAEQKPDLIHAHFATHYGVMAALQREVPFVQALWGSDVMYGDLGLSWTRTRIYDALLRLVVRRAAISHSSSSHVCERARQISGLPDADRFHAGFWGVIPDRLVRRPTAQELQDFQDRYRIGDRVFLSARGLKAVYAPGTVHEIIRGCAGLLRQRRMRCVVLTGNASEGEVQDFKRKLAELEEITTIISKRLNEVDLACLYHLSVAHLSIPVSDSLGGGVVEPAMCGSYPILSDIPGNVWFARNYTGTILRGTPAEMRQQAAEVIRRRVQGDSLIDPGTTERLRVELGADAVLDDLLALYNIAARMH